MADLISKLIESIGERHVLLGNAVRDRNPGLERANMEAGVLVCPADPDEVSAVMRLCSEAGQSVVVHGGLTGAVQGAVTTQDDVILSLERLNKIEALDPVSGTITAQAGVTLQTLQETAEASDYIFPLDIGSRGSCTIGGNRIQANPARTAPGRTIITNATTRQEMPTYKAPEHMSTVPTAPMQ